MLVYPITTMSGEAHSYSNSLSVSQFLPFFSICTLCTMRRLQRLFFLPGRLSVLWKVQHSRAVCPGIPAAADATTAAADATNTDAATNTNSSVAMSPVQGLWLVHSIFDLCMVSFQQYMHAECRDQRPVSGYCAGSDSLSSSGLANPSDTMQQSTLLPNLFGQFLWWLHLVQHCETNVRRKANSMRRLRVVDFTAMPVVRAKRLRTVPAQQRLFVVQRLESVSPHQRRLQHLATRQLSSFYNSRRWHHWPSSNGNAASSANNNTKRTPNNWKFNGQWNNKIVYCLWWFEQARLWANNELFLVSHRENSKTNLKLIF